MIFSHWKDEAGFSIVESSPWYIWLLSWATDLPYPESIVLGWVPCKDHDGDWTTVQEYWGDIWMWLFNGNNLFARLIRWIEETPLRTRLGEVPPVTARLLYGVRW